MHAVLRTVSFMFISLYHLLWAMLLVCVLSASIIGIEVSREIPVVLYYINPLCRYIFFHCLSFSFSFFFFFFFYIYPNLIFGTDKQILCALATCAASLCLSC